MLNPFGALLSKRREAGKAAGEASSAEAAEACKTRGNEHMARGKLAMAASCYRQAIALHAGYAEAHNNLGLVFMQQGKLDEAKAAFEQALLLRPDLAQAHLNRGNVFQAQGRVAEALASFHAAIAADPDLPETHNSLGAALQAQGRAAEALACYQTSIRLRPSFAEAHYNLGDLLLDQGQLDDALTCFERAVTLKPDFVDAYNSLGIVQRDLGRLDQASVCFERAIALRPEFPAAHTNLGTLALDRGDREAAYACFRRALDIDPRYADAYSNLLFAAQYDPGYTSARLHAEHLEFGRRFEDPLRSRWPSHELSPDLGRRLRIGFVSGDLRAHPVGYFMENVLANLDRQVLDVTLYPTLSRSDALSRRLQDLGVAWHPLFGLSDDQAARRIAGDGIDILVDLSGHTAGNRLLVFARKPAPVQVSWLYFSTTGLQAIDFLLCDRHVVPPDEARHFVEQPWYLPDSYLCFTPPTDDVPIAPPPALRNGYVTFGCFNNLVKINDAVVALWAQVLSAVPEARLLLKAGQLKDLSVQQAMCRRFAAHGIDPDRLTLEGPSSRAHYLSAYNRIDIALDPFPFPGGTTTVESLWMSVPVLTRRGDRFIAHAGESILHTVGLPDWIAADDGDYVAKARHFAGAPQELARLRTNLRAQFLSSPLCDAQRFARGLEQAFYGMWAECAYSAEAPPAPNIVGRE